jgi:hypothetical protein
MWHLTCPRLEDHLLLLGGQVCVCGSKEVIDFLDVTCGANDNGTFRVLTGHFCM